MTLGAFCRARRLAVIALLVAVPAFAEGQLPVAIDALTASPKNFTLLLENDHVRVLEYVLEPGQQDLPHTHPPKASYVLSGGTFEVHPDGAKPFVVNEAAGETSWGGFVGRHYVKNPGTSTVRVLLVEDKAADTATPAGASAARTPGSQPMPYKTGNPAEWPAGQDAVAAAAKNHKVLFENEFVRVLEVTVAPGEKEAVHHHRWRSVLYFMEGGDFIDRDARGTVTFDSRTLAKPLALPLTMWKEPEAPHSVENLGQTKPIRLVRFELKK